MKNEKKTHTAPFCRRPLSARATATPHGRRGARQFANQHSTAPFRRRPLPRGAPVRATTIALVLYYLLSLQLVLTATLIPLL